MMFEGGWNMRSIPQALTALFVLTVCAPAEAQSWRPVAHSGPDGDEIVWFVDARSIARNGNNATYLLEAVLEKAGSDGVDRVQEDTRADCANSTTFVTKRRMYRGSALHQEKVLAEKSELFGPGSPSRFATDSVCKDQWANDPIADTGAFARAYFAQ